MGSTALAWDVDCQLDRRLWRASAPCFWLVSNSWTWQKGRGDIDTFRPSRRQTETNRSQGTTSWKNSRRTTSAEKRCCSRHVGSSLFQFLGVTHHVPSMVWRDGSDWSDDSEVSTGGTRLDRRRKPECHVRAVCGCWTTGNKPGGWCECGHVLDTEGGKTYAQELHMETARSRSKRWLRSHCLRICANRSAQNIWSWPHPSQRSQQSPRKQWQFPNRPRRQESCVKKHVRPCGELAAGVRQPRRIRLSRLGAKRGEKRGVMCGARASPELRGE